MYVQKYIVVAKREKIVYQLNGYIFLNIMERIYLTKIFCHIQKYFVSVRLNKIYHKQRKILCMFKNVSLWPQCLKLLNNSNSGKILHSKCVKHSTL